MVSSRGFSLAAEQCVGLYLYLRTHSLKGWVHTKERDRKKWNIKTILLKLFARCLKFRLGTHEGVFLILQQLLIQLK